MAKGLIRYLDIDSGYYPGLHKQLPPAALETLRAVRERLNLADLVRRPTSGPCAGDNRQPGAGPHLDGGR